MALKSPDMTTPDVSDVGDVVASPGRKVTIPNPIVGSVKGAGAVLKFGGGGLSKLIRAGWRNKRDLGMIGTSVVMTAGTMAPEKAVSVPKNVIDAGTYTVNDPKGAAGSATTATEQALLDAADAAIAKGRQGMEIVGEKFDLPGTNNHATEPAPANPEKKN